MKISNHLFLLLLCLMACTKDAYEEPGKPRNSVTLIAINAPLDYKHFMTQDTIGKIVVDSTGPYSYSNYPGFTYLDTAFQVQRWLPKAGARDTLTIFLNQEILELSTPNPFLSSKQTFIVQKGDTVVFNYSHNIPVASVINRAVDSISLNYDQYRLYHFYNKTYSPHHLIVQTMRAVNKGGNIVEEGQAAYQRSVLAYEKEMQFLDSLVEVSILDEEEYDYRKKMLMMTRSYNDNVYGKRNRNLQRPSIADNELVKLYFDLKTSDSLLKYDYFRNYVKQQTKYNIPLERTNFYGKAGGAFIDGRAQFDSILVDKRLSEAVKKYLLPEVFEEIITNYPAEDRRRYLQKLKQELPSHRFEVIKKKYHMEDFSESLILLSASNDTLTLESLLDTKKDSIIYLNFWASWCAPCIQNMGPLEKLKVGFQKQGVAFIDIALNDQLEDWQKALTKYEKAKDHQYFTLNSKTSFKIDELGIKTIPHYLIWNKEGKLVVEYAGSPLENAGEQLDTILKKGTL